MSAKLILGYVNDHWNNNAKRFHLEDQQLRAAKAIIEILVAADEGDYQIKSEEFLTEFEDDTRDLDWTPADEVLETMEVFDDVVRVPGQPNMIRFGTDLVELPKVEQAVTYYGSRPGFHNNGTRIRPPLETMQKLFSFIKDRHHLKKIRDYEARGVMKADRLNNLKFLAEELKIVVVAHLQEGRILHDDTLRYFASEILKKVGVNIENFTVSKKWLDGWKRGFGLSSRKITKFVALLRHKSKDQMEKDSKAFVATANAEMSRYPPSCVFNADQSGFQLEMTTGRTLAMTGSKHVHCVVQSVSSTTHSYTVLPLIAADGTLHNQLFVNLKEKNGKFPKKGHFAANNLVVTCHSSHIMTKNLMKSFFEQVVFGPTMPKDVLLIVDSWSSWKDQSAIDSVTPSSNKIKVLVIPPGCTGSIQPCDVGLFGGFKKVVKTITAYGQISNPNYKMFSRDPTLKLISIVWWQLCSPKLKDWAQYAWFASGYNIQRPAPFKTPSEHFFPRDVALHDCARSNCKLTPFFRCIYCEKFFCFKDFIICYHRCC